MSIKIGQVYKDKKNGDIMRIHSKSKSSWWCLFDRSKRRGHHMTEFIIKKYYVLI